MAMESGKHVLCEQTAAYTVDDCERLIQTVRRTGQVYMMAENYCYFHYIQEWKQIISAGRLGPIVYAEGEYIHEIERLLVDPVTGERYWRYRRAPIWYCAHTLGPLLTLMDDRIVKATGAHSGRHKHPGESIAFLDMEVGLFQTAKGAVIKILRSQVATRYHDLIFYCLYGTKGFVENGRTGGAGPSQGRLFMKAKCPMRRARKKSSARTATRKRRPKPSPAGMARPNILWCGTSSPPLSRALSRRLT